MSGINGTTILFKLGTKLVAGQTSANYDESVDVIETTSKLSVERWKTKIGGEISGSGSVECIVDPNDTTNATYAEVLAAVRARELVDFSIGGTATGDKFQTGKCILTSISNAYPQNDKVTFSLSFETSGKITEGTVPA